ncbi:MAG TPA: UDP-N-acetylmuramate dehydrogenase [Acidiferrobacteraceae bacterium]|nr:UDP-N-acetylmuramate dehydrogenase [Acidiferrobacteraceae bacterium]
MSLKTPHTGFEGIELYGELRQHEPMARHTSWRVGGVADRYYRPASITDLGRFMGVLPEDESLYWLGLGSNLLVRDGGVRGTIIATSPGLDGMDYLGEGRLRVEAGVASAKVARRSVAQGLSGVEFLAGIPGSFGGALAMNAGAFGGETWQHVAAVEMMDRQGQIHSYNAAEFSVGYRSVQGPVGQWFVAGVLQLDKGPDKKGQGLIKSLLSQRGQSQPIGLANAGSVFRNPPGDYAARLIETAGLKGRCEGAACVSDVHANFIINSGGASAAQIEMLIQFLQLEVQRVHGVQLETEVHIVGEAS